MKYVLLLLAFASFAIGETFPVIHERTLQRDRQHGQIEITDDGINYTAEHPKESRSWKYLDIQYFDRISKTEFAILTYEDQKRYLGRDHQYRFHITDGELSDATFHNISARLGRPVTNRVPAEVTDVVYSVPVKHLHAFGGCEGELKFTKDAIYYVTDYTEDAREWQLARDVQSVWSMNRYQIEVHAFDNNRREFSRTGIYKFDLKQPLDADFYRSLKLQLYRLETTHLLMR